MVKYVSYSEVSFLKRFNILGAGLLGILAILESVFAAVTQHYMIISIASSLLLAITQGQTMSQSVIMALMTLVLAIYFTALLLDQYLFKKFPKDKGKLTLLSGIVLGFFTYFFVFPLMGFSFG